MAKKTDINLLIGNKFYNLTIVGKKYDVKRKNQKVVCRCVCGNTVETYMYLLKKGKTKSCGCRQKENPSQLRHGMNKTHFNNKRQDIRKRCNNKKSKSYKNYGGRGIVVYERRDRFENFRDDMYDSYLEHLGKYGKKNTTIDRIDVNGNYCKENCRRATIKEQCNNRTNNKYIEIDGEIKTLSEWSKKLGIHTYRVRKKYI